LVTPPALLGILLLPAEIEITGCKEETLKQQDRQRDQCLGESDATPPRRKFHIDSLCSPPDITRLALGDAARPIIRFDRLGQES
jgi:hypothetical protein